MKMEMLIEDLQTLVDDAFTLPLSGGKAQAGKTYRF